MYRKVLHSLAVTLGVSLLVIVSELTVLASVRAPARPLLQATGASPRVPAERFRPRAVTAPAAEGPSALASCHAVAEWAGPAGWALSPQVPERKISLGQVTILGEALMRGAYANRTAPTGFESVLDGAKPLTREQAPTLLLALAMLAAILVVSKPSPLVVEEATAAAARAPSVSARRPADQQRLRRPLYVPQALLLVDRTADWERVRLVPT